MLQQALLNLIYNAFDGVINQPDPMVLLSVRNIEKFIEFEVLDNGCGVSEAVAPNLFKPFVSDNTRKSGLGLGLTLAELIAHDHGGTLSYKPARPTASDEVSGSIFILSIPLPVEFHD